MVSKLELFTRRDDDVFSRHVLISVHLNAEAVMAVGYSENAISGHIIFT